VSPRAATWLAWSLAGLSLAMFLASVALTPSCPCTAPQQLPLGDADMPLMERGHLLAHVLELQEQQVPALLIR
jgi:hypothetical protein